MKKRLIAALMVLLLLAPFLFGGCSFSVTKGGFEIYLTKSNIPPSQMEILSRVAIADTPLISGDDIKSYTWDTHEIELTSEARDRLTALKVPTTGITFIVCLGKEPFYWGAFWAGYSSQSFDGVTIMTDPLLPGNNTIGITLGYPAQSFFNGEDPRSNPAIKDALEKSGKLK